MTQALSFPDINAMSIYSTAGLPDGQAAIVTDSGQGGLFQWDQFSTATINTGTIFAATVSGRWIRLDASPLNVRWFGAPNDGSADAGAAFNNAWAVARGEPIYAPAGRYMFTTAVSFRPTTGAPAVLPGAKIHGDGVGVTIFDNQVSSGALFTLDTPSGKFATGIQLANFTIEHGQLGIDIRAASHADLSQLELVNMTTGIKITCLNGDSAPADSSTHISLTQVQVTNCSAWGVDAAAAVGHNEISYLLLDQCVITECGTASDANPPTSGGMTWKGQILVTCNTAFGVNQNCGLYIPGQSGAAQSLRSSEYDV